MLKKIRNIALISIIICAICIIAYYIYSTYQNIDIASEYETKRVESTAPLQTVENSVQESQSVADMLEKVSESVVGISKIKAKSNSIFSSAFAFRRNRISSKS